MKGLTVAEIEEKYGIRRRVVSELVKGGFVRPQRGKRREYRFAFRDVVLMRMAQDLFSNGISPRKTARFLHKLSRELPDPSIAGIRISAAGKELVVRKDGRLRNESGQLVLDFIESQPASLMSFPAEAQGTTDDRTPEQWFEEALSLEDSQPLRSVECYRKAIECKASLADAYVNLGCLLLGQGQALEAYIVLEEGATQCADNALIRFNLGFACEELSRNADAARCYEKALAIDPTLADAHFNLARLHEEMGRHASAIRHLNAYRKLEQS